MTFNPFPPDSPPPKVEDVEKSGNIKGFDGKSLTVVLQKKDKADDQSDEVRTTLQKRIHEGGWKDYYKLRKRWSVFIMCAIAALIAFQIALTYSIGFKWLNFGESKLFLNLVLGENFAQIVGLGYIVVRYLFKDTPRVE